MPEARRVGSVTRRPPRPQGLRATEQDLAAVDLLQQDVVVLRFVSKTRAEEAEPRPYALLAERLERECRLSPEDLVVCVSEDGEADWSFGRGVAPFLTGDL